MVRGREAARTPLISWAIDQSINGSGQTDSKTVLDLLNGSLEVHDAIVSGRLEVSGNVNDVSRMFLAIDILLDASSRSPELQELASSFEADRETRAARWSGPSPEAGYDLFADREAHRRLLARLDLLS